MNPVLLHLPRAGGLSTSAQTGASGFTSGRILAALLERGHPGRALVRPRLLTPGLVQRGARIVPGDLHDAGAIRRLVESSAALVHVAAVCRTAGQSDDCYYDVNVGGTERLPEAWTQAGIATGLEPPLYRRRAEFFTKSRAFKIQKARRVLGYDPQGDCKEGLRRTATWYRDAGWA